MTKLLSTGEMIDQLKVGEIAEGNTYWEVKKLEDGLIVELNSRKSININCSFLAEKWRIHSNYVSFKPAMQAVMEGKTVFFHDSDHRSIVELTRVVDYLEGHTWEQLFNGKWTIEDGDQSE